MSTRVGTARPGANANTGKPITGKPGVFSRTKGAPVQPGVNAPATSAFRNPGAPVSTRNYPAPHYGNTYVTNNVTVINNNYNYDAAHYAIHVSNFYGYQSPSWGGHWRYGYFQPHGGVGVSFGFGFYVYTPFYAACVPSPWYCYPCVPAYIPQSRVIVVAGYNCAWTYGDAYAWQANVAWDSYGEHALNQAVDYIDNAFVQPNPGDISELVGYGNIAVFSEGNYEYSLSPGDFQQMMADNINSTQTVSFRIDRVRYRGTYAIVEAHHLFTDPNGENETVYQRYRLTNAGGRFYITDFMTSHEPFSAQSYF